MDSAVTEAVTSLIAGARAGRSPRALCAVCPSSPGGAQGPGLRIRAGQSQWASRLSAAQPVAAPAARPPAHPRHHNRGASVPSVLQEET